jgi:hypothetical protein
MKMGALAAAGAALKRNDLAPIFTADPSPRENRGDSG